MLTPELALYKAIQETGLSDAYNIAYGTGISNKDELKEVVKTIGHRAM